MHLVYKVFKAVIHFHPLSSARLPMNIRLTSPLHTTHVRYFPFCFRKFSQILSISGADENGWSHPRNFARPLCPLCIRFVSIGQWDRAISDKLKKPLNEGEVKEINRVVSGVRFVKGAGREMMYDGRIDGYDGEWKLIDTINVRHKITLPVIVGCIDECNVIITDRLIGGLHTYMLNLNTKHAHSVLTGSDTSTVGSCVVLNDEQVVCGKAYIGSTGDSLNGCITVYDRQWKLIIDVTIPRNTTDGNPWVSVVADRDGMIITAEVGQSKIYVINPADGKIINNITCKENIRMIYMLSSGHIIARPWPEDHRALIIDRDGAQREIPHNDVILNVCIDPTTDDLYVVTSDEDFKTCVIDQVMSEGEMKKRRVASFPLSTSLVGELDKRAHLHSSRLIMTSSGKLIASDGDNILEFKKLFSL